jgi:hypothetical protein
MPLGATAAARTVQAVSLLLRIRPGRTAVRDQPQVQPPHGLVEPGQMVAVMGRCTAFG